MESGGVTVMQVCITGSRADCGTSEGAWPQCLSVSEMGVAFLLVSLSEMGVASVSVLNRHLCCIFVACDMTITDTHTHSLIYSHTHTHIQSHTLT